MHKIKEKIEEKGSFGKCVTKDCINLRSSPAMPPAMVSRMGMALRGVLGAEQVTAQLTNFRNPKKIEWGVRFLMLLCAIAFAIACEQRAKAVIQNAESSAAGSCAGSGNERAFLGRDVPDPNRGLTVTEES